MKNVYYLLILTALLHRGLAVPNPSSDGTISEPPSSPNALGHHGQSAYQQGQVSLRPSQHHHDHRPQNVRGSRGGHGTSPYPSRDHGLAVPNPSGDDDTISEPRSSPNAPGHHGQSAYQQARVSSHRPLSGRGSRGGRRTSPYPSQLRS